MKDVLKRISSKENTMKGNSDDKLPVERTIFIKQKIKKNLDDLGEIKDAKMHRSANRPLHRIQNFNNKVKFCQCCNLPCEEKGIIEPFNYCDNIDNFYVCGLGVTFYFYFFQFFIVVLFISILVIIISMMVFNKHYTKGINRICNNLFFKLGNKNLLFCEGFVTEAEKDLNIYARFMKDGLLKYSSDNIKIYYLLHKNITNNNNAEHVLINYSVLNFLFLFVAFLINIFYILLINAKTNFIRCKKLLNYITIRDYTVIVSNAKYILIDYLYKSNENKNGMIYKSQQFSENKEDFIKHVKQYIKQDKSLNNLYIRDINMCYNLDRYMELKDELEKCKNKIFRIKNDANIININSEKGYLLDERYYYFLPLEDYGINCIRWKNKNLSVLEKEKKDLREEISKFEDINSQIISEDNFTGYMFISFEYIKDKETILKHYPQNFFGKILDYIKNVKYYLCCCFIGNGEQIKFNKIKGIEIDDPPEPEDIIWENYQYTGRDRCCKITLFSCICILIIAVSFGIVLIFTYLQNKITDGDRNINVFSKYLLSFLITIVILILNSILEVLLEYLTKFEKHLSRTNYYLSLSIKIAIFTFLNSAVVPLLAKELAVKKRIKEIHYNIDRNNLIIDDMFIMFLVNAIITPIFWTFQISFILNKIKIWLIERNEKPDLHHYKTQKELNNLYELSNMNISYKYAYLAKTVAMTFFYLPIFPIGFIISFLGFIFGYLLEIYNFTHIYKRPEMLDESISKFYADNFTFILFIGGISDIFFFYEIFPNKKMSLANFIIFLILLFIPYIKLLTCNFIGEKNKSEFCPKGLSEIYLELYTDYERQNPFTRIEGIKHYLTLLKNKNLLSNNALKLAMENMDNLNIMEIFYGMSRGNVPSNDQNIIANMNNYAFSETNLNLRKILSNADIRENQQETKKAQEMMDCYVKTIFGNRTNLENNEENPYKYPLNIKEEEGNSNEKFINAYNNPTRISLGLAAFFSGQTVVNSILINKSLQNSKRENSKDIKEIISNDNLENKDNKNIINNYITQTNLTKDKNNHNNIESKTDNDLKNKVLNEDIPLKVSINQSQNTDIKDSLNSIKSVNKEGYKVQFDFNKIPVDTNKNCINTNNNNDKNDNNSFKLLDKDLNKNKIISNLVIEKSNLNTKIFDSFMPKEGVLNNNNKEYINDSYHIIKEIKDMDNKDHIQTSKISPNEIKSSIKKDGLNIANLENDKINNNLSKNLNKEEIIKDNNNQ